MKCEKCGTEIMFASKFCFKCGAELGGESTQEESKATEEKSENPNLPGAKQEIKKEEKQAKKSEAKEVEDTKDSASFVERNYNIIFLGSMTLMLVLLTYWAFATAK